MIQIWVILSLSIDKEVLSGNEASLKRNNDLVLEHQQQQQQRLLSSNTKSNFKQQVFYISWTETSVPKIVKSLDYGNKINLTEVAKSDDSPLVPVDIPFSVPIFGIETKRLYVNSNGALHLSPKYPCACSCYLDLRCNFNDSYSGLIAGYLTDLDPSDSLPIKGKTFPLGSVTSDYDTNNYVVTWTNIPYFDKNWNLDS